MDRMKDFRHRKVWGQNFLRDKNIVRNILNAADLNISDIVLEIGPGDGILTEALAEKSKHVYAVEIDKKLYAFLNNKFKSNKNLTLIRDDILKTDFSKFNKKINKIVANIPYYITSQIIFKLLYEELNFQLVLLMMQAEVASRITAIPNTKEYGILSVICQLYWDVKTCGKISKNVFYPKPKVDSMLVKFIPKKDVIINKKELKIFVDFIKICFQQRRKKLISTVSSSCNMQKLKIEQIWEENSIDLKVRPENLSPELWVKLFNIIKHQS